MHCFVCDSAIDRGDEITKCIEVEKMKLRRNRSVGQRWVHLMCVPKDCKTEYFMFVLKELKEDYPDLSDDYSYSIVADHDYWTHESSDDDSFKNLWLPTKDMEYGWEAAVIKNYLFLLLKQKNIEFRLQRQVLQQQKMGFLDPILPIILQSRGQGQSPNQILLQAYQNELLFLPVKKYQPCKHSLWSGLQQ